MILTLKELAEHLKVNERTITRMLNNGQISGTKIGGQWRFNSSEIDNMFFPEAERKESQFDKDQSEKPKVDKSLEKISLDELTHTQIGIPVSRTMDASRIIMNLRSKDAESVIEELTSPKLFNDFVLDTRDLQEKCLAREKLCSTAVGNGIAVPHPRDPIANLRRPACITYGFSKNGIDFKAPDGKPVNMFFLICSQNIDLHLHLMGALANILRSDTFVKACMNAKEPEDVLKAVMEEERQNFLKKTEDNAR